MLTDSIKFPILIALAADRSALTAVVYPVSILLERSGFIFLVHRDLGLHILESIQFDKINLGNPFHGTYPKTSKRITR